MRILFVSHRLPFPPNRGGKIRPFHMIKHLSQKHSVVVASLAHTEDELHDGAGLRDHCEAVLAEVLPSPVRWAQALAALPTGVPSSVAYFRSARLQRRVMDAWHSRRFDGVLVHCAFAAQHVTQLQGGFRILDYGDVDSAKWRAYARHLSPPFSWGYGLEARKLRRFEIGLAGQFHCCTVTTPGELEELRTFGVDVPCTVIPNGVDSSYFHPMGNEPVKSKTIVFLGRMDYFPNTDAVCSFADCVFPEILKRVPSAEFRIIGSNPTAAVRKLMRRPGITVTGYVPDVRPHLADAALAVAPLRIARGTQNKILQCLALGIPVVATSEAAKGVQVVPGEQLLVADDPETFVARVVELLEDADRRARLSAAGRQQVTAAHDWNSSMRILDAVLQSCSGAEGKQCQPSDRFVPSR